jgi:hypothetical protein
MTKENDAKNREKTQPTKKVWGLQILSPIGAAALVNEPNPNLGEGRIGKAPTNFAADAW